MARQEQTLPGRKVSGISLPFPCPPRTGPSPRSNNSLAPWTRPRPGTAEPHNLPVVVPSNLGPRGRVSAPVGTIPLSGGRLNAVTKPKTGLASGLGGAPARPGRPRQMSFSSRSACPHTYHEPGIPRFSGGASPENPRLTFNIGFTGQSLLDAMLTCVPQTFVGRLHHLVQCLCRLSRELRITL